MVPLSGWWGRGDEVKQPGCSLSCECKGLPWPVFSILSAQLYFPTLSGHPRDWSLQYVFLHKRHCTGLVPCHVNRGETTSGNYISQSSCMAPDQGWQWEKSAGDLEGGMKQWPSGSGDQVQQQLTHAVTHAVIALLAHPGTADISWVHSRSRSDQISPSLSKPWAGYTFSSVTTGTRFSRASPVGSSLEAVRVRVQFVPALSHFTSNFCPRCRPCWSAEDLGPTPDTEATALHRLCRYFSCCVSLISLVNPLFCVTQNSCAVPDPMLTNTTNYSHGLGKRKDLLFLLPCGSSEQLFLPASAFLVELWSLSSPPPTPLLWSPSWPLPNHHHHYQNHDYHHRFHCHHHHQNHHQLPLPSPAASTTTITPALSPWIFSHQQIHLNYSYFTNVELRPREIK